MEVVRPGGMIFIGDVRSLPLLETFHAAVALERAPAGLARAELRQIVRQRLAQEEELALDPAFFTQLPARLPGVAHAAIHPRRGRSHTELTQFRYQAILTVGPVDREALEPAWHDWEAERLSLDQVRRWLGSEAPPVLALSGVPNARLGQARAALAWLAGEAGPATAGAQREAQRPCGPSRRLGARGWAALRCGYKLVKAHYHGSV
jgi:hypothetical protein